MKGPRRDGLYRADGFSRQHRLSRRPSPKRCAQTKLRHRNLYWQAVSRSRRPTTIRSLSGPQEPVRRCRGPSLFIGRSRRHRHVVPMEKFNSDSPRHLGSRIAQLRVSEPSQAADSFAGVPTASPSLSAVQDAWALSARLLGRFSKAPQNGPTTGARGIMIGLKSALCFATLTLPLALGGCAGALLVGGLAGLAGGGYAPAQESGVRGARSDLPTQTPIESAFAAIEPRLKDGVTTTVYQGRVLLAGTVATPQMKTRAVEVASGASGIKALYDNIEVAPSRAAWDATKDAWITARIRSELMLDPDIRSGNYTIDTQKGSVYLIGSARSQAELERATGIARYIPGVKRVMTYVELRPGAPVAQQPTPSIVPARSSTGSQSPQGS